MFFVCFLEKIMKTYKPTSYPLNQPFILLCSGFERERVGWSMQKPKTKDRIGWVYLSQPPLYPYV